MLLCSDVKATFKDRGCLPYTEALNMWGKKSRLTARMSVKTEYCRGKKEENTRNDQAFVEHVIYPNEGNKSV